MLRKQLIAGLFLFIVTQVPLFSLDIFVGLRGEGAITRGYGNIGLYKFTGVFAGTTPPVAAVRSTNQMVQFSGAVGLYGEIDFTDWYTLVPEFMIAFNRGLSYSGNYFQAVIVDGPNYPELTGEMRYSWTALNFNLINQFRVIRPNDMISIHLLGGVATSVILGDVKERFNPDFAGASDTSASGDTNKPYTFANTRLFIPSNRFDVGVVAGIGTQLNFGDAGRLNVDLRTTWYFIPQIKTHLSPDRAVRMSLPLSLTLGYSLKLS